MDRREVDFVIVGAGVAGMALQRVLRDQSAVLLDPAPGAYKPGESVVPQHFADPLARPLADVVAALPSATHKEATVFVSGDSVGWYPPFRDESFAMTVDRSELERATAEHFGARITRAAVDRVDVETGVVETDAGEWVARKLIVDCSGPARVVARSLGLAREVWPMWAAWAYHDILETDAERFWDRARSVPAFVRYDNDRRRLLPGVSGAFDPAHATLLTQVTEGTWTWQAPLFRGRMLAIGVLSRHGAIDETRYDELAGRTVAPQFRTRPRPRSGPSPHDSFHMVERFAWAADRFAGDRWALVGDAAFFGDPIFGVGTGLATNEALRLGRVLKEGGWSTGRAEAHHARTAQLWMRTKRAYDHWHSGSAMSGEDEVGIDLDGEFLPGHLFQVQAATAFADLRDAAAPAEGRRGGAQQAAAPGRVVTDSVLAWLAEGSGLVGWRLQEARSHEARLVLDWSHPDGEPLRVLVTSEAPGERYYAAAQGLGLRYQKTEKVQDTLDERGRALMEAVVGLARARAAGLKALL